MTKEEQLPSSGGILPVRLLLERSRVTRTATKDDEQGTGCGMHADVGRKLQIILLVKQILTLSTYDAWCLFILILL